MQIYISEDAIIANIQSDFHAAYPFLKLEFYQQPHQAGKASPAAERISPETSIDDIRMIHAFGWIDVSQNRTAVEVEYDFRHILGLNAQVMRRSGSMWLDTATNDNWTLAQLNNEGAHL